MAHSSVAWGGGGVIINGVAKPRGRSSPTLSGEFVSGGSNMFTELCPINPSVWRRKNNGFYITLYFFNVHARALCQCLTIAASLALRPYIPAKARRQKLKGTEKLAVFQLQHLLLFRKASQCCSSLINLITPSEASDRCASRIQLLWNIKSNIINFKKWCSSSFYTFISYSICRGKCNRSNSDSHWSSGVILRLLLGTIDHFTSAAALAFDRLLTSSRSLVLFQCRRAGVCPASS